MTLGRGAIVWFNYWWLETVSRELLAIIGNFNLKKWDDLSSPAYIVSDASRNFDNCRTCGEISTSGLGGHISTFGQSM